LVAAISSITPSEKKVTVDFSAKKRCWAVPGNHVMIQIRSGRNTNLMNTPGG
jgi:hypothetical protein